MSDELLYLLLLIGAQILFSDFIGAEHFHEASDILDQNVITCDHDLLVRRSRGTTRGLVISSCTLAGPVALSRFARRFVCLSVVIHFVLIPAWDLTFLWGVRRCGPLLVCLFLLILFVGRYFFFRIIQSLFRITRQSSALGPRGSDTTLTRFLLL